MPSSTKEPANNLQRARDLHPVHQMVTAYPMADVLLDCLRYDGQPPNQNRLVQLSEAEWQMLVNLALQQSVGPLLDHRLTNVGLGSAMPASAKKLLRQQYRHNTWRNLKLQDDLRQIIIASQAAGIPVIALKGIYLALAVYQNRGLREMHDIDLLVKRQDIDKAREVLRDIGYVQSRKQMPSTSYQHLPPLEKPGATARLELHWTIVPDTSPFHIAFDDLWNRAKTFSVADYELLALSNEDLILHLCLHSAYSHRFAQGIRSLVDIAETIRGLQEQLDWSILEGRSCQWQCTHATKVSLFLTNQLLNFQFPKPVMASIRGLDIDPGILVYIVGQLVGGQAEKVTIARNFSELWRDNSVSTKVRLLLRSIFRPKKFIAQMYGVPESSPQIYFYYLVRARDLWLRYGGSAKQMVDGESSLTTKVEADNALSNWLTAA